MTTEQFNALTPAEKRVAIAIDAIKQINLDRYISTGGYVNLYPETADAPSRLSDEIDFKQHADKFSCDVCQLGACLVSMVRLGNDATMWDVNSAKNSLFARLAGIFSLSDMYRMEHIFENWTPMDSDIDDDGESVEVFSTCGKADDLGYEPTEEDAPFITTWQEVVELEDRQTRMQTIFQNIIDNNGAFTLPKQA